MTKSWGDFEIIQKIGEGAFSQVFGVRRGPETFALKRLRPHLIYDADPLNTFKTEGEVLSLINEPHFPHLYEQGKVNDEPYLLMEWVRGLDLQDLVDRMAVGKLKIPMEDRVRMIREIAQGLDYLHHLKHPTGEAWVHGDLKARNVLVSATGEMKIIDLGLNSGTFRYKPLERLHDQTLDPFSDIFGLGNIFYELTHEKKLFPGKHEVEIYIQMREFKLGPNSFATDLVEPIRKILSRSLDQSSTKRYSNMQEMIKDLETIKIPPGWGSWLQELTHGQN